MSSVTKNIYSGIRRISSNSLNGKFSKVIFVLSGKPFVKEDNIIPEEKFPNSERGGLIISADFEMAWAWRYTKTGMNHIEKGRFERDNLPRIIKIFEEYSIPVTFAIVGHLFLDKCDKGDHDWMSRIQHFDDHWNFTNGDWYDHDPYSNYKDAPEWYAPDLIQMIINSTVEHEIGTHTFSHIDFSGKNCPSKVADDELKACKSVAKPYGILPESMVFPGGKWGNIEMLKKHGIKIYRKNEYHGLAYPYRDKYGLLVTNSSGSLEFNLKYGWSARYYVNRLKKHIDKAIKTSTITHFWFHPSLNPWFLEHIFPPFLEYAASQRRKGYLWIGTMKDIAKHINTNQIL